MGLGSGSLGCTRRRGSAGTSCPSYADPSSSPERRRSSSRRDTARGFALAEDDYREASPLVRFGSYEEALSQDVIVVLRCPDERALRRLRPGAVLVSMLHFPTRPERAELLETLGVHGVSLDAIVDETGRRLVENLEAVGWNGVYEAFKVIAQLHPNFAHPSRRPLHVTCLGAGGVGGHAVRAATRYGDPTLREELAARNVPGVEVTVVDFDLTWHEDHMLFRLESTDLLIDATHRSDRTRPVVPNRWIAALPDDAVLLDLAADPYDFSVDPPRVKGIEGVPQGDLDQWVFGRDDPAWDRLDPRVRANHRRVALSCYSWPGLRPRQCMSVYGQQLVPVLDLIVRNPVDAWDEDDGSRLARAVVRAEVAQWLRSRKG